MYTFPIEKNWLQGKYEKQGSKETRETGTNFINIKHSIKYFDNFDKKDKSLSFVKRFRSVLQFVIYKNCIFSTAILK